MNITEKELLTLEQQITIAKKYMAIIEEIEQQNNLHPNIVKEFVILSIFYSQTWNQLLLILARIQDHTKESIGLISLLEKIKDEDNKQKIKDEKIYEAVKKWRDKLGIVHLDAKTYCDIASRNNLYEQYKISLHEISQYLHLCDNILQDIFLKTGSSYWTGTDNSCEAERNNIKLLFEALRIKTRD